MNRILNTLSTPVFSGTALCCAAVLVSSCASHYGAQDTSVLPNDEFVYIKFDASGCPKDVNPKNLDVDKSKFVVWQSVEDPNDPDPVPVDADYQVYFDPFVGKPQKSNTNGWVRSLPFNSKVPPTAGTARVEYKYTIVGEKCEDTPLDPRITLRR
jgi:hypothetical protein